MAYFGHLLAQCVFLVIQIVDVQVGYGPAVHFSEQ
jgi:hypothetical protein